MKIEPKDIQVGDRVTLSGTVLRAPGMGGYHTDVCFDGYTGNQYNAITQDAIAQAEITRPVDPDVGLAERVAAGFAGPDREGARRIALAAIKAVRAERK
jgi:hypothetical protein